MVTIATVGAAETEAILAFLAANQLPEAGLREHATDLLVARDSARLLGTAALEVYGDDALLRSVAVDASARGTGLGQALTHAAIAHARTRRVRRLFLLTETAAEFFVKFGFSDIGRDGAPDTIRGTVEFASACPASARLMVLHLAN
jgi:amino-acid N-acetyltransferase